MLFHCYVLGRSTDAREMVVPMERDYHSPGIGAKSLERTDATSDGTGEAKNPSYVIDCDKKNASEG